ncbi:P-loop containing nucleoside triphosphate hydrolase protein [Gigaspora rosea]|uniref:DNA 3'-5' helicase n=1 Tax=Gigaspora rosea TaxID=44941 RepID=A0A397VF87_9GLOM|nr:P-loop containing nucleoside triphosphate hydrolase protein [Gigaspora rosea]
MNAAVTQIQNPDIISPTDNDLYVMQSEICVNHLLDNHDNCWAEICWKVQNPELFLADPNLIGYTESQANALKEFLKKHTKLPPKQSLITSIRTSMNEAFNRVKLNYTDKKVDYAKSFSARHGLAVLHNNNGLLEMLEIVKQVGNLLEFSKEDEFNIGRIWKQREDKRKCNVAEINKRNVLRAKKIEETRKQIEEFDFSKLQLNYREFQQESIESFLKKQDTLTILPTEAGKSLSFSATSILTKALMIIFTPLKAIMECQLHELIEMGIPAAKIYTASNQPLEEQEKIFAEVAAGITKVLWVTPEKFIESLKFCKFLNNVSQTHGVQFVIDESHCVLEFEYFRPAWTKLEQIKEKFPLSPILLLTATCSCEGVHMSDVRIIIYTTFPLSSTNFVQEVGRAGRDRKQAKSIILYSRSDIHELLLIVGRKIDSTNETQIVQYNYLEKMKKIYLQWLIPLKILTNVDEKWHMNHLDGLKIPKFLSVVFAIIVKDASSMRLFGMILVKT